MGPDGPWWVEATRGAGGCDRRCDQLLAARCGERHIAAGVAEGSWRRCACVRVVAVGCIARTILIIRWSEVRTLQGPLSR
jgi:hypothetical protein